VTAGLPPGVTFKGNAVTANGTAPVFDVNTKKVTWTVGNLPFGTGNGMPRYEATFQVGITPASNQVGATPTLITASMLTGTDAFTSQAVQSAPKDLTTSNIENHSGGGRVQ
jgi:hypothetical protein